jgi:hypothetical protein
MTDSFGGKEAYREPTSPGSEQSSKMRKTRGVAILRPPKAKGYRCTPARSRHSCQRTHALCPRGLRCSHALRPPQARQIPTALTVRTGGTVTKPFTPQACFVHVDNAHDRRSALHPLKIDKISDQNVKPAEHPQLRQRRFERSCHFVAASGLTTPTIGTVDITGF